jgi:hypothetical protein
MCKINLLCGNNNLLCGNTSLFCANTSLLCGNNNLLCGNNNLLCPNSSLLCAFNNLLCRNNSLLCSNTSLLCAKSICYVQLHEIHMHAKCEVSTVIISKVMAIVKVGHKQTNRQGKINMLPDIDLGA